MDLKPRNYWLEGVLELGRNWALAVTIASAGMAAYRTETVTGPIVWEVYVFWAGIAVSIGWMLLAVLRFDEGLARQPHAQLPRLLGGLFYLLLAAAGVGIVLLVGKFSENNTLVELCDRAADRPDSAIYQSRECTRLRVQRHILIERLDEE